MSGQLDDAAAQAAPPNAVAPGPEGPAPAQQSEAEVDWAKRYNDLQPEYTRTTQENAELRRQAELYEVLVSTDDPDTRRMIAEQLGYQLDEEPEQAQDDDPWAARDARLERIEAALSKRDEDERSAAYAAEVRRASDAKLEELGIAKDDQDWVLAYAINALPATADGLPDIEGAHRVFAERETARQRDWARTKRAPHFSPNGQAATEVPNLDNHQERVDWMVRRLEDGAAT